MADDYVAITEAASPTGKLDAESLTVGANTVKRERMQIAGSSATQIAPVSGTDGLLVNLGSNNDVVDTAAEASLAVIDDWDESDRAKVNPIVGQAGVAAGAGAVGATVQRVTHASDDPVTTALQIIDDWDETDRAKVNVVVGQAGITAGAGAVAANTPRVTHASDDPVTTALQIIDDWDESDRAKVNPIAGQAGVQGGAGAVTALTQRVVAATDSPEPTEPGDWITGTAGGVSTLAAAGDYGANDVLSNSAGAGAAWQFANAARASGGRGWIAHVSAYTAITAFIPRLRFWFFNADPTASVINDNVAFSIHANDLDKLIDFIDLPAMASVGGGSFASNADARLRFELAATTLFCIIQILDAETDETAGMAFVPKVHVIQD